MDIRNEYGEKDNICNTPRIATIEVHHNKYGSGEYFVHFIEHAGTHASGSWQDREISKEEYETLMAFCAPTFTKEEKEKDEADYIFYMMNEYRKNHGQEEMTREEYDEMHQLTKKIMGW